MTHSATREQQRADIHAFQRRLMEIMKNNEAAQRKWRVWLIIFGPLLFLGIVFIYNDFATYQDRTLMEHLINNKLFSFTACVMLILVVVYGAHDRAFAQFILAERTRKVLTHFGLTCNDDGRLAHWPDPNHCRNHASGDNADVCLLCNDNDDENDDLCISEEEEANDIYRPFYDN